MVFLTNQPYIWGGGFGNPNDTIWQTNIQNLPALPQFGLLTTNRLQAYILDGNHVIDYVQFNGPTSIRDLNAEIRSVGNAATYENMWTTNVNSQGVSIGILNQINASKLSGISYNPSYWKNPPAASEIDGFYVFMGGSSGSLPVTLPLSQTADFNGYLSNLVHQVPYTPTVTVREYTTWQANDPLVHYLGADLSFNQPDTAQPTGLSKTYRSTNFFGTLPDIRYLNARYKPWGQNYAVPGAADISYNSAYKDPLMTNSDSWNFPTNKLPTVGWLGRVHRGTPWQTVYLKASGINVATWMNWTGNLNTNDAINAMPTKDRLLFDDFTTTLNDNATRGQLSINQGATGPSLAAWSAVFSGIAVPTSLTNSYSIISPAGVYDPTLALTNQPPLVQLVQSINDARADKNLFPQQTFAHVGDILAATNLTQRSPFLAEQDIKTGVNDALMEWLPQQTLSLLRLPSAPRYVIYSYGQTLKPAPNSVVTGGPSLANGTSPFGMVTNYQVVAETATRAVVQINPVITANPNGTRSTNYTLKLEQFNVLPPD